MPSKQKKKVILASASPRRKHLLKKLLEDFLVRPSRINETKLSAKGPVGFTVKAALAKALDVAQRQNNALVIGADTIVVLGKEILGKPKNQQDAIVMLRKLAGKTHRVITGIAIVDSETQKRITAHETTWVKMKNVLDKTILDYVKSGRPMDKAGSYGIQEIEQDFGLKVNGDYDNVVGLPVLKLKNLLRYVKLNWRVPHASN